MASFLSWSFPLLFLSLALLCCVTFADLIDDVCTSARNPSLCSKSLRAGPRSRGADLKLLGQISVDLATKSVKSGVAVVTNLKNAATDPRLKGIYDTCLENYQDSVDSLAESAVDLKNSDYLGMNLQASAAETGIDTCDQSFDEAGKAEPAELKAATQNGKDLCSIILVISNRLRG